MPDPDMPELRTARRRGAPKRAPKRVAGRRRGVIVALVALLVLIVLAGAAAFAGWYLLLVPDTEIAPGEPVEVTIAKGSGTEAIGEQLSRAGVVPNALMFRVKARLDETDGQFKAGTYELTTGMEYEDVFAKLVKGPEIAFFDVPIPEGFTGKQIAARFAKRVGVSEDEMLALVSTGAPQFAEEHPYLADAHEDSLEGYLFPATYRVKEGVTPEQIVEMMLDKFDAEMATIDLDYAESKNLTLNDVLTIASIIELEVKLDEEYPLVSSVIYNRLKIDMKLQLDSTVFYTLPEGTKVLTKADLNNGHPYNTYSNYGLPPGPLGNPGRKAIDAAAHPSETEYLYYVLTGEDGSQTFATNYTDFMKAVKIYREKFVNK